MSAEPRPGEAANKVALVIGAGGVKCAASIGVQAILQREGIGIDLVVGCSGGSLYATQIALGIDAATAQEMTARLWRREVTSRRNRRALLAALFPRWFRFDMSFGLLDDRLMMAALESAFGERTFADTRVPLHIVATDFMSGEKVVLNEGRLVDAVRASISLPFLFRPWPLNGRHLVDGSQSDPLPVDVAIRENANVILAVGFELPNQRRIRHIGHFAGQLTTLMTNQLLAANFAFHNLAHHAEVVAIIPEFKERVGTLDVGKIPHVIEEGAREMEAHLPYLRKLLAL